MTDAQRESWLDRLISKSDTLSAYYLNTDLDDSSGWGRRLEAFFRKLPERQPSGLLFTGPKGCGKHHCVGHVLQTLYTRSYGTVFLSGSDLPREDEFRSVRICLNDILDRFFDEKKDLCLIVENLEASPFRREILEYLGVTACEYLANRDNDYPDLVLILLSDNDEDIPAVLRSRLQICRMSKPDERQRRRYLQLHAAVLTDLIPLQDLTALTEGMNYAELSAAIDLALLSDLYGQDDGAAELRALLEAQCPERNIMGELPKLAHQAMTLLERLPEALEHLPARSTERATTENTDAADAGKLDHEAIIRDEASYLNDQRKRAESLPLKELMMETLGKENAEMLLEQIQTETAQN